MRKNTVEFKPVFTTPGLNRVTIRVGGIGSKTVEKSFVLEVNNPNDMYEEARRQCKLIATEMGVDPEKAIYEVVEVKPWSSFLKEFEQSNIMPTEEPEEALEDYNE